MSTTKKVTLYSIADKKQYTVEIDESTDLDSDDFDWEKILLRPIEDRDDKVNTDCGVSWGIC